ncbi:MAG: hypothetical protein FWE62_07005, partial [Firmicutes bacterium]|nr:hypothetical protein [Bacillota bacterium]
MPIDYVGNAGINGKLMKHFGTDHGGLLDALHIDFRGCWPSYAGKPIYREIPGLNVNPVYGYYTRWVEHRTGGYCDF